jgi:hypothetical protein
MRPRGIPYAAALAFGLVVTAIAAGCAAKPLTKPIVMAWPEPRDPPRVVFVTVTSDLDLKPRSGTTAFLDALIGRRYEGYHLFEQLGIAVTDDGGKLYVSDRPKGVAADSFGASTSSTLRGASSKFTTTKETAFSSSVVAIHSPA